MSRHKWEPIGLRGRRKECKVCGCIKITTNLTPEYEMPDGTYSYGKAPACIPKAKSEQQNKQQ